MKKALIFTLVLVLVCGMMTTCCADFIDMEPNFTNAQDKSCSEWLSSGITRAILAVSLLMDYMTSSGKDIDVDLIKSVVGRDDSDIISAYYPGENGGLVIMYFPTSKRAAYTSLDSMYTQDIAIYYATGITVETYKSNASDILYVLEIMDTISD